MGAVPESQIKQFIDKIAGPDAGDPKAEIEAVLAEAKQLLADGDHNGAAQLFGAVMQADPENAAAIAGIAECMIAVGQYERASELLSSLPAEVAADAGIQLVSKRSRNMKKPARLATRWCWNVISRSIPIITRLV